MSRKLLSVGAGVLMLAAMGSAPLVTAASAQAPGPMKSKMVGGWNIGSISIDGKFPYGSNPQGSMLLTADGHYSLIVLGSGTVPTLAAFGTYVVNEADGSVTLHVDGSTEGGAGHEMHQKITFNQDSTLIADAMGNAGGAVRLSFKRSN